MATGDMKNNLMKLLREVRRMKIGVEPDVQSLSTGSPSAFLSLLHAAMMHYSLPLANWFTQHGYDLYGRSDLRFLQELYRMLRDVFNYKPKLTKEQFLSVGFAERKVLMTRDVLLFCQAKSSELASHVTSSSLAAKRRVQSSSKPFRSHINTATVPKRPPEVLTIQERPGVGSVWCDSTKNFKVDEPFSPPSVAPPPSVVPHPSMGVPHGVPEPTNELDVTFTSPSPPRLRSSSPHLLSSTPPPLSFSPTHDEPCAPKELSSSAESVEACVVRHQPPAQPPLPTSSEQETPLPTYNKETGDFQTSSEREQPLPASNEVHVEELDTQTGEERDVSPLYPESWKSLPEREGERGMAEERGSQDRDVPEVVGSRVEQLTRMVEKLSAKLVLLETQLKLSQSPPGQRSAKPDQSTSVSLGDEGVGRERGVGEGVPKEEDGVKHPLRDITDRQLARPPHPSLSKFKEPHLSSLKQFASREPTPLHNHPTLPPLGDVTPPHSLRRAAVEDCYTTQESYYSRSLTSHMATPSTPEETNRLIESLRARAKETKEFLHFANSRFVHTSQHS